MMKRIINKFFIARVQADEHTVHLLVSGYHCYWTSAMLGGEPSRCLPKNVNKINIADTFLEYQYRKYITIVLFIGSMYIIIFYILIINKTFVVSFLPLFSLIHFGLVFQPANKTCVMELCSKKFKMDQRRTFIVKKYKLCIFFILQLHKCICIGFHFKSVSHY